MPSFINMSGHSKARFAVFAFLPSIAVAVIFIQFEFDHGLNFGWSLVLSLNSSWLSLEMYSSVMLRTLALKVDRQA